MDILSIRDTTSLGLERFFEDTPQEHDKKNINSFTFWKKMRDNHQNYNNFPRYFVSRLKTLAKTLYWKEDYFILFTWSQDIQDSCPKYSEQDTRTRKLSLV